MKKKKHLAGVPETLEGLERLALNMRWSWNRKTRDLFASMDKELWRKVRENPVAMIEGLDSKRLVELSRDPGFVAQVESSCADLDEYVGEQPEPKVAYLSMEYGLHESLPIYSGGLGVLSGDHLKASSDLGLPLVAVGFLYRKGYFTQRIDGEGRQFERLPHVDPELVPVQLVCDRQGNQVVVQVEVGERTVRSRVWLLKVGRIDLYLLDTDLPKNAEDDRRISWQLYIGDRRKRLEQETVLGVGAVRLLEDILGVHPETYHLNEGHCALSLIERLIRCAREKGGYERAIKEVRSKTVFTTHTPVAAGNEEFSSQLVEEHFLKTCQDAGIDKGTLLGLGTVDGSDSGAFSLTVLALKLSRYANAVSRLHGEVCREMWKGIWPDLDVGEVPISHITNGVHGATWRGRGMELAVAEMGQKEELSPRVLWNAHLEQKKDLIEVVKERLVEEGMRRGERKTHLREVAKRLSANRLTVGFARRFATYKRGALILEDLGKLDELLNHPERPLQLLFAGKAHPADEAGKEIVRKVFQVSRDERFAGRVVLLEDYDMELGRLLTGGVDLWLNNPVRPMEACGTSGMKAVLNGVLNCSIRDGWWDEVDVDGYGFSVVAQGGADRDAADREALVKVLRDVAAPMYYHRAKDGVPQKWAETMGRTMGELSPRFSARRMVADYSRFAYGL